MSKAIYIQVWETTKKEEIIYNKIRKLITSTLMQIQSVKNSRSCGYSDLFN